MGTSVYYKNGSSAADRADAARRYRAQGYSVRWTKRNASWAGEGNVQYTLHFTKKKKKG